jgi:hypothetical protein
VRPSAPASGAGVPHAPTRSRRRCRGWRPCELGCERVHDRAGDVRSSSRASFTRLARDSPATRISWRCNARRVAPVVAAGRWNSRNAVRVARTKPLALTGAHINQQRDAGARRRFQQASTTNHLTSESSTVDYKAGESARNSRVEPAAIEPATSCLQSGRPLIGRKGSDSLQRRECGPLRALPRPRSDRGGLGAIRGDSGSQRAASPPSCTSP